MDGCLCRFCQHGVIFRLTRFSTVHGHHVPRFTARHLHLTDLIKCLGDSYVVSGQS